jgi:hypothetical protein
LIDKKNGGLGSAKRPSHYRRDDVNNNKPVFNNSLCDICGGNHKVLVISLENGGHIVTHPFSKEKTTKVKITLGKRRATRLDLVNTFWPSGEDVV